MNKASVVRLVILGGLLGIVALLRPLANVGAQPSAEEAGVRLAGIVRDFKASHADFGLSPAFYGHVAGNVALAADERQLPVLQGPGFRVDSQWYSSSGDPIAPHMYAVGPGAGVFEVASTPTILNQAYADTYNPDLGPYSEENSGPGAHFLVVSEMPTISVPTDLPEWEWRYRFDSNRDETTVRKDLHGGRFYIANNHTVWIEGDVTIVCRDLFLMENHGHIRLREGATLTIYTLDDAIIRDQCSIGMGAKDHERIRFYHLGDDPVVIQNQCDFWGTMVSPNAPLRVADGSEFFGSFTGEGLDLINQVGFHVIGNSASACGFAIADTYGAQADFSDGDISSASSFSTWFRDAPGKNVATRHDITLRPVGGGFLEYDAPIFYPVDGDLYGNEGGSHNENFTYQVGASFTFKGCADQIIEVQGSDDIWVYVDDRLVIDLGGIGANQTQVAELDRLGLVDGQEYSFMVYFAHRSGTIPSFRLRTNLDIKADQRLARAPSFAGYD